MPVHTFIVVWCGVNGLLLELERLAEAERDFEESDSDEEDDVVISIGDICNVSVKRQN